jgi:hypothetical protein
VIRHPGHFSSDSRPIRTFPRERLRPAVPRLYRLYPEQISTLSPRTVRNRIGYVVLALLAIAAIMVGALALVLAPQERTPPSTELRDRVQFATTEAYERIHPEADRVQASGITVLAPLVGRPKLQSRVVTCELEPRERGFTTEGWRQLCTLRTVDLYQTNKSYDQLSDQLAAAAKKRKVSDAVLGAEAASPPLPKGCPAVRFNHPERESFHVGNEHPFYQVSLIQLQAGRFKPLARYDPTRDACSTPPPYDGGYYLLARVERTFADSDISVRRSWLVVERETEFLRYDLGCIDITCSLPPLHQPVLP